VDLGLKGLRALVTGGTKGIGRATVEVLLDEGASVAFCARNAEEVALVEAAMAGRGAACYGSALDVGVDGSIEAWVPDAAARLGGIDILVSNVSAMATADTPENWERCLGVDVLAAVRLVKTSLPLLERSPAPAIVTVASVSGREIDAFAGPYGAAKAALVHYTQGLAYKLAPQGIRANTVSPGNTLFEGGSWERTRQNNPEFYATILAMNPMGHLGTPEEMARAIVFLASPASSFTTGTNLVVDGALTRGVQL
jgi:3-oxoacyl-[acyl-carrier protein] reductase